MTLPPHMERYVSFQKKQPKTQIFTYIATSLSMFYITNSMEHTPSWETDSPSASHELPRHSWNT
jgi:hypothetical protein